MHRNPESQYSCGCYLTQTTNCHYRWGTILIQFQPYCVPQGLFKKNTVHGVLLAKGGLTLSGSKFFWFLWLKLHLTRTLYCSHYQCHPRNLCGWAMLLNLKRKDAFAAKSKQMKDLSFTVMLEPFFESYLLTKKRWVATVFKSYVGH